MTDRKGLTYSFNSQTEITMNTVCSFIKALNYMQKNPSGRLRELKNSSWVKPKVVVVAYRSDLGELHITNFKPLFKRGYTKVVANRAGRCLPEWSEGDL